MTRSKAEMEERQLCTEEEDSENDEVVDIERIEDKEEDIGNSSVLVRYESTFWRDALEETP